jgi:hypothetical protein
MSRSAATPSVKAKKAAASRGPGAPSRKPGPGQGGRRRVNDRAALSAKLRKVFKVIHYRDLAAALKLTAQAVHQWQDVPPLYALGIERATGGKITKEYLAPQLYPKPRAEAGAR